MSSVEIYSVGLVHASVCAPASMGSDEVAEYVNTEHPTGVTPWAVTEEAFATGEPNPVACNDDTKGRKHWLLTC